MKKLPTNFRRTRRLRCFICDKKAPVRVWFTMSVMFMSVRPRVDFYKKKTLPLCRSCVDKKMTIPPTSYVQVSYTKLETASEKQARERKQRADEKVQTAIDAGDYEPIPYD